MLVFVPSVKSKDGENYLLFIELKRVKGGVVSPEQQIWIESINSITSQNVAAYVAKGADEAIKIVSHYLLTVENFTF